MLKAALIALPLFLTAATTLASVIEIIPHESCNEIRTSEANGTRWILQSSGGSQGVSDPSWKTLQSNAIDRVGYGRDEYLTLSLLGKRVVPESLALDQKFGIEVMRLNQNATSRTVGKFIGLTDINRETGWLPDATAQFKKRDRLLFAAILINEKPLRDGAQIPCVYVAGDLNVRDIESGLCFWIDAQSRGSNGRGYCW